MKVDAAFAASHFDDLSSAVDRGEEVEIVRPGKAALRLVTVPAAKDKWIVPVAKRPRSELFGSLAHLGPLPEGWDSPEVKLEVQQLFEDSEIFPKNRVP